MPTTIGPAHWRRGLRIYYLSRVSPQLKVYDPILQYGMFWWTVFKHATVI